MNSEYSWCSMLPLRTGTMTAKELVTSDLRWCYERGRKASGEEWEQPLTSFNLSLRTLISSSYLSSFSEYCWNKQTEGFTLHTARQNKCFVLGCWAALRNNQMYKSLILQKNFKSEKCLENLGKTVFKSCQHAHKCRHNASVKAYRARSHTRKHTHTPLLLTLDMKAANRLGPGVWMQSYIKRR